MEAQEIHKIYSVFSGFYDMVFGQFFHASREEAIGLLDIRQGERILEVGVGTGLSLRYYPPHCQVTGIDFCEPMLKKGRARLQAEVLSHIHLIQMDAMALTFPDNAFDSVFAAYVISAVPDPHRVLAEMIRVCKPGGKIVLLNHFQNGNRLISRCERAISPLTKKIGFRSDLNLSDLLTDVPLHVEKKQNVKPFNYWKVIQCINQKGQRGRSHNGFC